MRHFRLESGQEPCPVELDESFFWTTGVFTTLKVESDGDVFRWPDHLERLREGCRYFQYPLPTLVNGAEENLLKGVLQVATHEQPVVRVAIAPYPKGTDEPPETRTLWVVLSTRVMPIIPSALRLTQVGYDRLYTHIKHLSRGPEIWLLPDKQAQGWDEILRINYDGVIAEACYANVFMLTDEGRLLTPDVETSGCLPGIMRQAVMAQCEALGLPVETGCYEPSILPSLKGMFLTNAVRGLMPVAQVDDSPYDVSWVRPLTRQLSSGLRFRNTI